MENTEICPTVELAAGDASYRAVDLRGLAQGRLDQLPVVLRLLLENVARNMEGAERGAAVEALLAWSDAGTSEAEIAFQPGRVLMHDTTSTPALVDLAAMRSTLAEAGVDPSLLNSSLPVDVSVDHSLAVEAFARPDAPEMNMAFEIRRNAERYGFLRWASKVLRGVRIHPPGTGIMHTINLEQLATVATTQERDGCTWLVPDVMIGTDSHTPMVNGIGVLGWGVGGLEAQTVMFGMPTMLRVPDVIGVRLTGALRPGVLATDLALTVTQRLRAIGVSGEFVEFFGPGVSTLSAGDRCVVANMAPEYGATTGFFPVDQHTLDYLQSTGRDAAQLERVRLLTQAQGLWFDPAAAPRFTRTIEIDLDAIGMHVAGPRRPQDLLGFGGTADVLQRLNFRPGETGSGMPRHPVAIAAITSCTNTSDPRLLIAAGLVARKARAFGLKPLCLGEDIDRPRLPGRGGLPGTSGTDRRSFRRRLRHRGLWLHDLHRQSGAVAAHGARGHGQGGHSSRRCPLRQPQLPRPGPPGPGPGIPDVTAAGDCLRARGRCREGPARRSRSDRG